MESSILKSKDFTSVTGWKESPTVQFAANEVHIWTQPLPNKGEDFLSRLDIDTCILSQDERERVQRKQKQSMHDAQKLVMSRTFLREVLAMYTGQSASDIHIEYGTSGKPYVQSGPQFNLSHTEGCCVLALAAHTELGIDLEHVRPLLRMSAVIRRFMTEEEQCYVLDHQEEEQVTIRRVWQVLTHKEAWIKACGQSLCGQWRNLNTRGEGGDGYPVVEREGQYYHLQSLNVGPNYSATLCTTGKTRPLIRWLKVADDKRSQG
ncbi:MAG: 4'-phosphopantetheinyl transferase superfamily protein [Paenibacillus sp.]|uniref:4'-phosphopantetheinyl transferase family protein n=1 Tax=Paenibacillus sp. TaxID=58172 RepID=UPI003B7EE80C